MKWYCEHCNMANSSEQQECQYCAGCKCNNNDVLDQDQWPETADLELWADQVIDMIDMIDNLVLFSNN